MNRTAKFAGLVSLASSLSCNATAHASNGSQAGADIRASATSPASKQDIVFKSGELTLHGVIYRPSGAGPFPAVLWTWAEAPELRGVMIRAARASRAPMFLFQAENDFDLSPSQTLEREMTAAGKTVQFQIYPPYGTTHGQGHNFAWLGGDVWGADVLAFLQRHCGG